MYEIADREAIFDTTRLLFSYLDRVNNISNNDKDKIDAFLRHFLPLVFALSPNDFALELMPVGGEGDDLESIEGVSDAGTSALGDASEVTSVVGGASSGSNKRGGKKAAADLRKKALKNAGGPGGRGGGNNGGRRSKVSSPAPSSRDASPAPSTGADTPASDTVMSDAMPTITSLASLITPEVEAEIAANRGEQSSVGTSREASALLGAGGGEDATRSPSLGPGGETMERGDSALSNVSAVESVVPALATPAEPVLPEGPLPELIVPVDDKPARQDARRQWNLFANTHLYCLIRLFQVRVLSLFLLLLGRLSFFGAAALD